MHVKRRTLWHERRALVTMTIRNWIVDELERGEMMVNVPKQV